MKTVLILTGVLTALLPVARAEEWQKTWPVSGKPELHISTGDGAVILEPGGDSSIDAVVSTRGYTIGSSGVRIIEHQNGNRVDLDVKVQDMIHFGWSGVHSIEVRVRVPRQLMADVHTSDGSIKLHDLSGSIRLDSSDGSIDGDHLDGTLDAHSGDGSLHLNGRFDSLQVHTSDGSIDVTVLKGSRVNSDWRVQSGDGSVQVHLPPDLSANLELHTGDGSINLGVPLSVTGTKSEHSVQGKLNSGGAVLQVRTSDGSISITSL